MAEFLHYRDQITVGFQTANSIRRGERHGKGALKVTQDETEVQMAGFQGKAQPRTIYGMSYGRLGGYSRRCGVAQSYGLDTNRLRPPLQVLLQ